MSKAEWLRHYEEVKAEFPDLGYDEQVALTEERHIDEMASRADALADERKYRVQNP